MATRSDEISAGVDASARNGLALETFFDLHYGRLIRLAGLVCGDARTAEDIVQTALERAWRSRAVIRDGAPIRPWLDRIVVREAAREHRTRLTWLGRFVRPPSVTEIAPVDRDVVDGSASQFPVRTEIRLAFEGLTPAHRAVVVLCLYAGYTVDEAAQLLRIPRDTVRSRLRSAREHLRLALKEDE